MGTLHDNQETTPASDQRLGGVWYLLPITFGIIGGWVGWGLTHKRDRKLGGRLLIAGTIQTGFIMVAVMLAMTLALGVAVDNAAELNAAGAPSQTDQSGTQAGFEEPTIPVATEPADLPIESFNDSPKRIVRNKLKILELAACTLDESYLKYVWEVDDLLYYDASRSFLVPIRQGQADCRELKFDSATIEGGWDFYPYNTPDYKRIQAEDATGNFPRVVIREMFHWNGERWLAIDP